MVERGELGRPYRVGASFSFGVRLRFLRSPQRAQEVTQLAASAHVPVAVRSRSMFGGSAARFLVASGISFYGDWLTTVALVVLLFRLTGSPTGPALYMLFRVAPRVLGAAPGGALADRYGPVRLATFCAVGQGVL